jgi:hypothetical protein
MSSHHSVPGNPFSDCLSFMFSGHLRFETPTQISMYILYYIESPFIALVV